MKYVFFFITLTVCFTTSYGQGESDRILQDSADRFKNAGDSSTPFRRSNNFPELQFPKELKQKLEITKAEKQLYRDYLEDSDSRLFKLWNNQCTDLGKVVDAEKDKDCLAVTGYELGSIYSFENRKYLSQTAQGMFAMTRTYPNATIALVKQHFRAANLERNVNTLLSQIMTDLGETSLSAIERNNAEVKKLSDVQLLDQKGKSVWKAKQKNYDINFSDNLPAVANHTYLLRSIFLDSQNSFHPRLKETIYAFRLIKLEDNIALILWKKISSKWI